MQRQVPKWIQYIFLVVIISGSLVYLTKRETINATLFGASAEKTGPHKGRRGANRQAPVIVTRVNETRNNNIIAAIGDGRAKRFVSLNSRAPGEIITFPAKVGAPIKKGEIILELDARKQRLAIKVAQTKLDEAQRIMARAEQLRKRNVVARANVDDAKTQHARAELELEQAKEALSDRIIKAPFDGVLGIPKVEIGDQIASNIALVTLDDRSSLIVEFDVAEQFYSQLKIGQRIEARTPSAANTTFAGFVKELDSRIDTANRTVKVRAEIPNKKDILRPGMSFAVRLAIEGRPYPTVPELALQWGRDGSYVWRIVNNKAERVLVRMIKRFNSNILVEGKLAKNDIIVVEGVQRLRPGTKVKYSPPPPQRPPHPKLDG